MSYVADLHIHSRFSRACSKEITIPNLAKWGKIKGIDLVGTGDCFHPIWQAELKQYLKEHSSGFYEYDGVLFIPTCEVSCIYQDKGKVRRIHLVLVVSSLKSVEKIAQSLRGHGVNLSADGRPITGMSAKQLTQLVFEIDPKILVIPAHVWTPWYSLYGSMSGYDSITDCFEELSDQIFAIETGLSSEPAMNWRIAELDSRTIASFSDAHSLPNLGREATVFRGNLTFEGLASDLKTQNLIGTIEFFPEEGKYHYSGHRTCGVIYSPEEVKTKGETCPVCKKQLTIGVAQRVEALATRNVLDLKLTRERGVVKSKAFPTRPGFRMLVGLEKIIADAFGTSPGTKRVKDIYDPLIATFQSELLVLTKVSKDELASVCGPKIAEGIELVRQGELRIEPGYDNTYGKVHIFEQALEPQENQMALFV